MQHLAVKAAVAEITDLGEFEALAATWAVDRVKDQIVKGAFANTIAAWQASGKMLPVHWAHSNEAKDIIGVVDPHSMRETDGGLYVKGRLDLAESEVAREAWRSIKNNAVALSFGYMVKAEEKRRGGINALLEIDLFEITVASGPINPETRFLSLKAAMAERTVPSEAQLLRRMAALGLEPPLSRKELRRRSDDVALDAAFGWEPPPKIDPEADPEPVPTERDQRRRFDQLRIELLMGDAAPPAIKARPPRDYDAIRNQARIDMLALLRGADG